MKPSGFGAENQLPRAEDEKQTLATQFRDALNNKVVPEEVQKAQFELDSHLDLT